MMTDSQQHLVGEAGIVDAAAEAHSVRYLCDCFVRLKRKMRADKVNCNSADSQKAATRVHTSVIFVNENENDEKRENNEFVNENENEKIEN